VKFLRAAWRDPVFKTVVFVWFIALLIVVLAVIK